MTTVIQHIQSPVVNSTIDEHDNNATNHDDATQTIFFRVVNGKVNIVSARACMCFFFNLSGVHLTGKIGCCCCLRRTHT